MTHLATALASETLWLRRGPCILLAYVWESVHAHGNAKHTMTHNILSPNDDNFVRYNTVAMTQKI